MLDGAEVPIIIVGYRTPEDIAACLHALARLRRPPSFGVVICENGGPEAFDDVLSALGGPGGPCPGAPEAMASEIFPRLRRLRLGLDGPVVIVGEARENLGY